MSDPLVYVYGIVPPDMDITGAPSGIDDAPVELVRENEVGALVSEVSDTAYDERALEKATEDLEWLGIRAAAHDGVLTWASERGAVAPFSLLTLFRTRDRVRSMLAERAAELTSVLAHVRGAHEYGVRVYRVDSELLAVIGSMSEHIAGLERAAAAASPGQRYLLERKLVNERRGELRSVSALLAQQVHVALSGMANDSARVPLPRASDGSAPGTLILDGRYLVRDDALEAFRRQLTTLMTEHQSRGLRFEFTGPWPPYQFATQATER
jgi:hypothetical protein